MVARKLYHKEKIKYSRTSKRFSLRTIVNLVGKCGLFCYDDESMAEAEAGGFITKTIAELESFE